MASSADVREILGLSTAGPELSADRIMGKTKTGSSKSSKKSSMESFKKPEGMARELYNLLYNDPSDSPSLIPSDTSAVNGYNGYKALKAKLGIRKVRPWSWMKFTNPARSDGLVLRHWRRVADEGKDYPFARFNRKLEIPTYTETEYNNYFTSSSSDAHWTRAETDHLFELCIRFDLRFTVIHDRWDKAKFPVNRTIEQIKERYYGIVEKLEQIRGITSDNSWKPSYDAEHEKKRKDQLIRLYNRTPEQIEEEEMLRAELRKIENRKKEREKKTQDLQKLIDHADQSTQMLKSESSSSNKNKSSSSSNKKKTPALKSKADSLNLSSSSSNIETAGIKWPEQGKGPNIYLRSSRMKLPPSVGQKKVKALEQMILEIPGLDPHPMPKEDIVTDFNELRSEMVLLYELKNALANCEAEMNSYKIQYETLIPGKTLEIPEKLKTYYSGVKSNKNISDVIDVVGNGSTPPVRKRKAALEQSNVLKKIKNKNF